MNDSTFHAAHAPAGVLDGMDSRYLGPGVVVDAARPDEDHLQVALPTGGEPVRAELAAPGVGGLRRGERVLVSVTDSGGAYVIGVLGSGRRRLDTRRGASAEVVTDEDGERVEVRDPEGSLIFRYDPDGGRAELTVPRGSLDVQAPEGDLNLRAGRAVRLTGRTIDLAATSSIRAFVHDAASRVATALRLGHRSARLDAETVRVDSQRAQLQSERIDTEADEIRTTARRIRTTAEVVTQRFGSLCRRVKGLVQSRAGRMRTLISGSWRTRAERADLRSRDTFKVDGRKIHLG